jgi:hypothetical protein
VRRFKREGLSLNCFRERLERVALGLNLQFPRALGLSEIRAICKSVAKWTWSHFSEQAFSRRQALRGARRAAQMWSGHVAATKTKPWEARGISRATYYRRKKQARP